MRCSCQTWSTETEGTAIPSPVAASSRNALYSRSTRSAKSALQACLRMRRARKSVGMVIAASRSRSTATEGEPFVVSIM